MNTLKRGGFMRKTRKTLRRMFQFVLPKKTQTKTQSKNKHGSIHVLKKDLEKIETNLFKMNKDEKKMNQYTGNNQNFKQAIQKIKEEKIQEKKDKIEKLTKRLQKSSFFKKSVPKRKGFMARLFHRNSVKPKLNIVKSISKSVKSIPKSVKSSPVVTLTLKPESPKRDSKSSPVVTLTLKPEGSKPGSKSSMEIHSSQVSPEQLIKLLEEYPNARVHV